MYRNNWTHQHEKIKLHFSKLFICRFHTFTICFQMSKYSNSVKYRYSTIRAHRHRILKNQKLHKITSKQNCSNWYLKFQEYASTILCYFIHQSTDTVKKKEKKRKKVTLSHELLFKANGITFTLSLDDFFRKLFLICKF